ncbi:MAG: LysM peptidoglycan-binding domain-containing protein [Verrucomicrobiota bacterium]|nr:LysM peptidoglycan-binding domain-containing protein [Verrucomicrobiota bacterium]
MKFNQINIGFLGLLIVGCGIRERSPISLLPSIGVKGGEVHPLNVDFADYPDAEENVNKEIDSIKTEDYKIRKGDSLWKISRDRKTSISILRQLNGISGDLIREGQVIKVPFVEGLDLTDPAEEKPAEEKPAEEKPAEEKPAEEKPAEDLPNGDVDDVKTKEKEVPELLPIPEIEDDPILPIPEKP